jgi:hypothetical protein
LPDAGPGGAVAPPADLAGGGPVIPAAAPTFTLPGFYGAAPTTFTGGEGRLGRPRIRYNASISTGYDDNVFQTPTEPFSSPDQVTEVVVDPGTPDTFIEVPETRQIPDPNFQPSFPREPATFITVPTGRTLLVVVPGTPPKTEKVTIPGVPPQERLGSFITRAGAGIDIQLFTRRTLFTFDVNASANHYWNRPDVDPTEYNGSLSLNLSHRITPRLQGTAQVSASYLSQPDYSRINSPTSLGAGNYIVANAKGDLSYRWTPRFTSVASLSNNSLTYEEKGFQAGNYSETVFGTEQRYLFSPRFTFLAEARYSFFSYELAAERDSNTTFLLLGTEFTYSRLLSGSVRVGVASRKFLETGEAKITPYMETVVVYRIGRASVLSWNTRFGFEEPGAPTQERVVLRTGLNFNQAFSPRFSVSAGVNYLHETTTDEAAQTESTQDTFDASLTSRYLVTRRLSLNATYSFTTVATSTGSSDFYRNRLFIGGEYTF